MDDPWNASTAEIEEWAYSGEMDPEQDWHLAVTQKENGGLIFRLACDPKCPEKYFFLGCLYLFVGDAVRSKVQPFSRKFIDSLLALSVPEEPAYIERWRQRSRHLLQHPEKFDYELWCKCRGGYAGQERNAAS